MHTERERKREREREREREPLGCSNTLDIIENREWLQTAKEERKKKGNRYMQREKERGKKRSKKKRREQKERNESDPVSRDVLSSAMANRPIVFSLSRTRRTCTINNGPVLLVINVTSIIVHRIAIMLLCCVGTPSIRVG